MILIGLQNASLSFGNLEILTNVIFSIKKDERICLTGKNGVGKSTLLNVINKTQDLDSGHIIYKKDINICYLKQKNPNNLNISVYNFIKKKMFLTHSETIHAKNSFKIDKIIEELKLNKNVLLSELSGGHIRKVLLSTVLVQKPDVLLLDEPTNHLDINTIQWLEHYLRKCSSAILFTSHDRSFIENICTKIVYLDRGRISSFPGIYKKYIQLKNEQHHTEDIHKKLLDYNLKKEEIWIKKGVKARTTRNEGRVKNFKKLCNEKKNYKHIEYIKNIEINEITKYSGKIALQLKNINFFLKNKIIINNFSEIVQNGEKIGLIGENGSGKSTMIKIIMGEKEITSGNIYYRKNLKIAYFDQDRSILNPEKSIIDNIYYGKENFFLNGKEQYIVGYLKNFLFHKTQLTSLVKTLSGGECNRLLLAKIFLQPSNILILDEPTNDLDIDTLQLLEKVIVQYQGTILIVSHDRSFMQNTVKKYWFFEKNGLITTYIGNINNFFENHKKKENNIHPKKINSKKLLSIKKNQLKIELRKILNQIENIEKNIALLQRQTNEPHFFKKKLVDQLPILKKLNSEEKKLSQKIIHWEHLEKNNK